ncbi:MAG: hypothetical protein EOP54_21900 [Sphingobacteriales bacterium]|nr:MAG: hypothetical protein EOP54_21900 [Sphingobacteriales bacterium]
MVCSRATTGGREIDGCEVVLSEDTAAQLEASGEDVAEIKAAMVDGMKESGMADVKMVFKKGLTAEFHKAGSVKDLTYTLAQKDGANYIIRSDGKELRCKIEGGYLKLIPESEDLGGVALTFEKKK